MLAQDSKKAKGKFPVFLRPRLGVGSIKFATFYWSKPVRFKGAAKDSTAG